MSHDVLGRPAREALAETRRQCTATSRSGERCRLSPIEGGFVCTFHGGSVPAVRKAARARLLALVDPILTVFEEIVERWRAERCTTCGHPTGDPAPVIRLGQIILDRTGFHPTHTLTVETPVTPAEYMSHVPAARMELISQWLNEAKDACRRGDPLPDEPAAIEAEDAVLVENDDAATAGPVGYTPPGEKPNEP